MASPRYRDGTEILIGDNVRWAGRHATIVFVVDARSYSPAFPEAEWSYLGKGIMLDVEGLGLVHEELVDEDLEFVSRTAAS